MPIENITSLDDRRLEPFREIRHRNWTEQSGWFIAEGPILLEQLLASDFACLSVLVEDKFLPRFEDQIPDTVEVFVLSSELVDQLVGFKFHRGVIACGSRRELLSISQVHGIESTNTLAALTGIHDPENLGGILRNCAGLGIRQVLLGPENADPFSRRALRVAMGTTFELQLIRSENLVDDLQLLKNQFGVQSYATAICPQSIPLEQVRRSHPAAVLFGNEKKGLPQEVVDACDHQIQIQMHLGVDSLNVNVAAGIILHYFAKLSI